MRPLDVQRRSRLLAVQFFRAFPRFAVAHPGRALALAALVTLAAAPGVLRLKLRTDGHALVPDNAPEVVYDRGIRDHFGIEDQVVVWIHATNSGGIFNPATVETVRALTAEIQKIPGVDPANVNSLATEPSFRLRPGTLIHQTMLEPPLTTRAQLDELREDMRRIELYTGTFVSLDGKSTVILAGVPAGVDRAAFCAKIFGLAEKGRYPEEIGVTGAPVAEMLLGTQILEDLGVPRTFLGAGVESADWKMPASPHELRLFLARHVGLVPAAALVMIAVFLLSFRNLSAALLPLPGVAATILFVFGLMGWLGVPVYLTTAVLPVLLTTISVTNDVYLFNRYFGLLRENSGGTRAELVRETFDRLARPVASTSLAAVIGFLSFAFSPLVPVRAFGIFTGVGALFGLLFSLTVLPALLALINPVRLVSKRPGDKHATGARLPALFGALGRLVARRPWLAAGVTVLAVAAVSPGLRKLAVQDSWTNGFDPDSRFRRVTERVNSEFFGMHLLYVSVEAPRTLSGELPVTAVSGQSLTLSATVVTDPELVAGSPVAISVAGDSSDAVWRAHIEMIARNGDQLVARLSGGEAAEDFWRKAGKAGRVHYEIPVRSHFDPELIRAIGGLGAFIRERKQLAVGGVLGPADYLLTTRFMARPNDPDPRVPPADAGETKLLWDYYRIALGPQRMRQLVDTNFSQSLTTVFLKDANFADTAALMEDIRGYERDQLAPKGIRTGFAGDVAVSQSLIRGIVTTQLQSLGWSLAGIFLVTAFLGGSWRWGFFCVLPSVLAIVIKFALMGWLGIPLGVATSMFAAMTLGIGVNCAIHLLEGCAQAQSAGAPPAEAADRAVRLTGPPAAINTLAMSLGFGVLMLSQVPANARLGFLLVAGLVNCLVVSLVLLPALLHWWPVKVGRA